MKLIFLDIDGVMNCEAYMGRMADQNLWDDPKYQIDPQAVIRLNKITDATKAKIVISSTWRIPFYPNKLNELIELMRSYGITGDIIGMTPLDYSLGHSLTRTQEIKKWLDYNIDVDLDLEKFIILDDEFLDDLLDCHIKTSWYAGGLQDEDVEEAIKKL